MIKEDGDLAYMQRRTIMIMIMIMKMIMIMILIMIMIMRPCIYTEEDYKCRDDKSHHTNWVPDRIK